MTSTGFAEPPPPLPPKSFQLSPKWFSQSHFSLKKSLLKCPFLILNTKNLAPDQFLHGVKIF